MTHTGRKSALGWPLLIMLTAVFLRLTAISSAPPGLTHDEADHGLTAWQIAHDGVRELYFPIGYGREPLYDYATAGLMALLGQTYLAGRLTSAFASLLLVAAAYAWTRRAFDRPTALLAMAGLAVGFWPVMTGRQMLRSTLLPTLFTLAVAAFWHAWQRSAARAAHRHAWLAYALAGLLLGLTFYVYIPARALWGVFPALLLYLAAANRARLRRVAPGTLLLLGVAGLVGLPLFRYLAASPGLEARIAELSTPLSALAQGDLRPILDNTLASLRLFTVEGDPTWRYNLPQRPFLPPIPGILFYAGLLIAAWRAARPNGAAHFLALAWLLAGMAPVFVTGPELSTTHAIGAQPVLYLFPALALAAVGRRLAGHQPARSRWLLWLLPLLLFAGTGLQTARAYFGAWANAPEVRVQYESTMLAMLAYLDDQPVEAAAISTITPFWAHSPAVADLVLRRDLPIRWFDGRSSLLLPGSGRAAVLFPGFAPLAPPLLPYWQTAVLQTRLPMRPTDLDRPVDVYALDAAAAQAAWQAQFTPVPPATLGDHLALRGYALQTPHLRPGSTFSLVTWWQVLQPAPQVQLFTHLWAGAGAPAAQAVALGAPGDGWRAGDQLLQLHQFTIPPETAAGPYQLLVGAFDLTTGQRYPALRAGQPAGDTILLTTINLTAP
ncbi:MAG: glycosyltransferase family 39 protein [Anaerolineales bacterium]|nr:glycosyltransferase family 39 protein [Anaerolineales bacterium]